MNGNSLPHAFPNGDGSAERSGHLGIVLDREAIREFQRLICEHCGITLTETEAWNRATELVALYRMLLGPIPEDPMVVAARIGVPERPEP